MLFEDSRPLKREQLDPSQQAAYDALGAVLESMRDEAKRASLNEGKPARPPDGLAHVDTWRAHRVVAIEGQRGAGKTTVLLSWIRDHAVFEQNGRPCLALDLLDFDPLPPTLPVLVWLLYAFERAARASSLADKRRCDDHVDLAGTDWRSVVQGAARGWNAASSQGKSVAEVVLDHHEQVGDWQQLRVHFHQAVDELLAVLERQCRLERHGLLIVPIDDADMHLERSADLLHAVRLLYHPRVVWLLTVAPSQLELEMKAQAFARARAALPGTVPESLNELLLQKSNQLGEMLTRKILPPTLRFRVEPVTMRQAGQRLRERRPELDVIASWLEHGREGPLMVWREWIRVEELRRSTDSSAPIEPWRVVAAVVEGAARLFDPSEEQLLGLLRRTGPDQPLSLQPEEREATTGLRFTTLHSRSALASRVSTAVEKGWIDIARGQRPVWNLVQDHPLYWPDLPEGGPATFWAAIGDRESPDWVLFAFCRGLLVGKLDEWPETPGDLPILLARLETEHLLRLAHPWSGLPIGLRRTVATVLHRRGREPDRLADLRREARKVESTLQREVDLVSPSDEVFDLLFGGARALRAFPWVDGLAQLPWARRQRRSLRHLVVQHDGSRPRLTWIGEALVTSLVDAAPDADWLVAARDFDARAFASLRWARTLRPDLPKEPFGRTVPTETLIDAKRTLRLAVPRWEPKKGVGLLDAALAVVEASVQSEPLRGPPAVLAVGGVELRAPEYEAWLDQELIRLTLVGAAELIQELSLEPRAASPWLLAVFVTAMAAAEEQELLPLPEYPVDANQMRARLASLSTTERGKAWLVGEGPRALLPAEWSADAAQDA